jgi:hypothetical protein
MFLTLFFLRPELLPLDLNILKFLHILRPALVQNFLALSYHSLQLGILEGQSLDGRLKFQLLSDDFTNPLAFLLIERLVILHELEELV